MRVRLPHSNGLFLSQKGTQFTDMRASVPDGKRFCPGSRVPESRIEGNVPHLRAKFTHFVGYLPIGFCSMQFILFQTLTRPLTLATWSSAAVGGFTRWLACLEIA